MIPSIGQDASLARTAIEAALETQSKAAARIEQKVQAFEPPAAQRADGPAAPASLFDQIQDGVGEVNASLASVERLPLETATGGIEDFSELAARLKQSELTFKFALEVRNKLIDAYRETMRMSV
jgi:flagellar hook-basal body complex protein FliE